MDTYCSPVKTINNEGERSHSHCCKDTSDVPSRLIHIDSRQRDRGVHVNASRFRLYLPYNAKHVYSIELRQIILPVNEAAIASGEHYAVLKIGNGTIPRGGVDPGMSNPFAVLEAANSLNPNGIVPNPPAPDQNWVASGAFAVIPLNDANFPGAPDEEVVAYHQFGPTGGYRAIHRFFPPLGNLNQLDFELSLRTGTADPVMYPFPDEPAGGPTETGANWSAIIEITAMN